VPCSLAVNVNTPVYRVHGRARPCTRYVHGRTRPCTTRPCTQAVKTTVCTVHGRVHGRVRICTGSGVYGREQPCTRVVNTPGYRVHGRVRVINGPCTWPVNGRVHGLYTVCTRPFRRATAVDTGRKHARVHDHCVHGTCTAVYTVHTWTWSCTPWSGPCKRPMYHGYTGHVHAVFTARADAHGHGP